MLKMSSLRVMLKRSKGKKQQKKIEKQHLVIVTKPIYLNVLLQKVFEIMTKSSPVSLIVAAYGISYALEDFSTVDPQRHLPLLSSLQEYFRS